MLNRLLRTLAMSTNNALIVALWRLSGGFSSEEWTAYVRKWGGLQHVGEDCDILPGTVFDDPDYVWIGNNVRFSECTILGHDASVAMLNKAYGTVLDAVGAVIINDNVFIGFGAIILAGVTIGANSIIAAGAVVTKDVESGTVVAGSPARPITTTEELVARRERETRDLPWYPLLLQRGTAAYDARLEPQLRAARIEHFFGDRV
jgi:acetyltransferase-like isoleucine patch superfamily enzyme